MVIDMAKMKNVGRAKLVKSEREKRGWPQEQLAGIAGLSGRTVQRVEKDGTASMETLRGLASAFNMTVEELTPKNKKQDKEVKGEEKIHFLPKISSGKQLTDLVSAADAFQQDYDELENKDEVDLVAGFLQNLQDIGEIWSDVGVGGQVDFAHGVSNDLKELEQAGFAIFGIRRKMVFVSQGGKIKTPMEMSTVVVKRSSCPQIVKDDKLGNEFLPAILK